MFWIVVGVVFVVWNAAAAVFNGYLFTWTWFNGFVVGIWVCEVCHDVAKYYRSKS